MNNTNITTNQKLNHKIAKWLYPNDRFYYSQNTLCHSPRDKISGITRDVVLPIEDLTTSLDIFDLVATRLKELGYMIRLQYSPLYDNDTLKQLSDWTYYVMIDYIKHDVLYKRGYCQVNEKSPALCICLAVEQLIDDNEGL